DVEKLRILRNRAVHFTLAVNAEQINSLLAQGYNFFLDFSRLNLPGDVDPNSEAMSRITENLREFDHFVRLRLKGIKGQLKGATRLLECDRCWQPTLRIGDGDPTCFFCGYKVSPEQLADEHSEAGVVE